MLAFIWFIYAFGYAPRPRAPQVAGPSRYEAAQAIRGEWA